MLVLTSNGLRAFARLRFVAFSWMMLTGLLPAASVAQTKPLPEATRRANLEAQLTEMEQAFMKEDFEAYADFMHPDVLRVAGGADVLAKQLRQGMEQLSAQGGKVSKVSHGAPSRIVGADRELQCTVPQTTEFQLAAATKTTQSTLLAVSSDGGQHWAFLDTNGKDWETVRRLVPSLSREIELPGRKQ
ncbi:hypothetical protein LJ737_22875 [Hymenobacter sp. 15J16-1T3B]|uniref:hypothetical protein n=1 Tax=Hymenobacter sp. 15J16-1T3B TaxID=2886941 RepID=UPI001D11522D|nr:hypothetical protein [Hymenobacter sp. 15J16-1T3B]MCC3160097.1 hypothetical protein [Hymenobacter sp. 15J16-1T3B]